MLLAGRSMDEIAQKFNQTVRTIYNWKADLRVLLADEARSIDPFPLYGEMLATYREARAQAMRMAEDPTAEAKDRIRATTELRQGTDSLSKFLKDSGFYDLARLTPKRVAESTAQSEADALVAAAREILGGARDFAVSDVEAEEEAEGAGGEGEGEE